MEGCASNLSGRVTRGGFLMTAQDRAQDPNTWRGRSVADAVPLTIPDDAHTRNRKSPGGWLVVARRTALCRHCRLSSNLQASMTQQWRRGCKRRLPRWACDSHGTSSRRARCVCADLVPSHAARLLSLAGIPDLVLTAPRSRICSSAEPGQRQPPDFAGFKHGLRVGTDCPQPRMRKSAPAPQSEN